MRKIDELRPRLDGDIRNHSNGHDFLSLLTLDYGKRARKNGLQNAEAISAALRGCVDLERIEEESLFSTLRHKLLENAVE
jgi:hypothetical protein